MNYLLHLLIYFDIYVIVALSLNIVVGYCGLLTLAHAGYFVVGAYTYALVTLKLGFGFIPAAFLAVLVAGILSLAISLPAWRFKGDFFVMISLAVQTLIFSLLYNWFSPNAEPGTLANLTNGPFGLAGISKPAIGSIKFAPLQECSGSFLLSGIKVQSTQMEEDVRLETLFAPIAKSLFDQPLDFIV